ncbi:MAG: VOC family protein [Opitutaceae bacterium]
MNINVSDLKRSSKFYGPLFEFLGYERADYNHHGVWAYEDWKQWLEGTPHEISIVQAHGNETYEKEKRRSVGRHNHIAFCAEDRKDIDQLYEKVLVPLGKEGLCTVEDPPCECPEYGDGYYATFFSDPDGLKYEFVINPNYFIKRKAREERLAEPVASHNSGSCAASA